MSTNDARRDALARLISPESWEIYDLPNMSEHEKAGLLVIEPSRRIAQRILDSGIMASMEWDRREYLRARDRIIERTSKTGRCSSVEDGLDGYFMHDPKCIYWPDGAVGGSGCVK